MNNTYFMLWILFECLFYIQFRYSKNKLQRINKPATLLTKQERMTLFHDCLSSVKNIKTWAEGWFYRKDYTHPSFQEIKRDNIALW